MWPDRRLLDLFGIEHPIVLAPMASAMDWKMTVAVSEAGGLGSLPCAMLAYDKAREEVANIRARTEKPFNMNFFCHKPPSPDNAREASWRDRLKPYYDELGLDPNTAPPPPPRVPFNDEHCELIEELKPVVVSFHFGLPEPRLVKRVKAAGCKMISSATTAAEARWLEGQGADAVIAQGLEAGGHRGIFLSDDISTQPGTFALVPQVVDAVKAPVIAAGGIGDARGIAAAFALGAAGVQMGTAFLHCPESMISVQHREALADRPTRALHRQSPDPRAGADFRRAGLPERSRRGNAAQNGSREAGLRRLLVDVVGAGGGAGAGGSGRGTDADARGRGAGAVQGAERIIAARKRVLL